MLEIGDSERMKTTSILLAFDSGYTFAKGIIGKRRTLNLDNEDPSAILLIRDRSDCGFYQKIKADTDGNIPISSLFPDVTPEQADEIRERLDEWVEGLPPAQEIIMREVIQKINDYFEGREPGDSEIHYVLDKRVAEPWNLIFGAQYQHNKNWQIRSEIGTFGKRTQFLLNLNYRFPGFRKR